MRTPTDAPAYDALDLGLLLGLALVVLALLLRPVVARLERVTDAWLAGDREAWGTTATQTERTT